MGASALTCGRSCFIADRRRRRDGPDEAMLAPMRSHSSILTSPSVLSRKGTVVLVAAGYPVTLGDATASAAAMAFVISGGYSFRTLGGSADVDFRRQIRSRIGIGGALPRRAHGPWPRRPCDILDLKLGRPLPWQSDRPPELAHL